MHEHQHRRLAPGQGLARFGRRQFRGAAIAAGDAIVRHRADLAARPRACADRGAEIHLRLDIGIGTSLRQQCFGVPPQLTFDGRRARPALEAGVPAEQPLDVAVEDRQPRAEAEHGDGVGGGTADARQFGDGGGFARKGAGVFACEDLRALVQVARPRVVAQPAPERHHLVHGGFGKVDQPGAARQEALVVGHDGADLRLLQHDFRQPDAIGIAAQLPIALPRQIVAAVTSLPGDQASGEGSGGRGHGAARVP